MKTTDFIRENTYMAQESAEDISMVVNNLHTIMRVTADLASRLKGNEELDEWVKEKIAVAKAMMTTVEDYVASQQEMGGEEESLPSFDYDNAEQTMSEMIDDDDDAERKIQHLMQKYGWSHHEAMEYYYYEKHDPADWEGIEEDNVNELSSDLLKRSAQAAKNKSNQAMDPKVHSALGGGYSNPLSRHYDAKAQKFSDRASIVSNRDAVKKVASPATLRKLRMAEGKRTVKENATGGATGSPSISVSMTALGEKGGFSKSDLNKKLGGYSNRLSNVKKVK
jgi:hypothetical protein